MTLLSARRMMTRSVRACCIAIGMASAGLVHAAQSQPAEQQSSDIEGKLNSLSYGWNVTCIINGHDVGLKGDRSESMEQYGENSTDAQSLSPEQRAKYAPLHLGRNTVKIIYNRSERNVSFGVNLTYEVQGYPAPIFYAHVENRQSGIFEGVFYLAATPPANFKPLIFTESDPATSGILYLSQGGEANFFPSLETGGELMQMAGNAHGVIPFSDLHPGANKLSVTYSTPQKPLHLYILGPKGASTYTLQSAKIAKTTFVIAGPDPVKSKR